MTTETRRRIRAYKKALPELRERVVAVALLLAMSVSMLTTASFAWLTISRRPEVTGVSTTVAANGNLEIALATGDTAPGESKVGDSSAAEGQTVTGANITWGNLVNLSDPSYGLDHLTLRPAQLNTAALLTSPLFGAVFTADGRVEKLTSNFSYTSWVPAEGTTPGYFGVSNSLGVRAISSTKIEAHGYLGTYLDLKDTANSTNAQAAGMYTTITKDEDWMTALANMMGIHMTATLNYEEQYINASANPEDLLALIEMYGALIEAFEMEAQAMANLLNLELYAAYGGDSTQYQTWDKAAVLAATANSNNDLVVVKVAQTDGTEKIVQISNFKTFINDYNMLIADKAELERIDAGGDRRWTASGLKTVINRLVDINKCLIDFGDGAKTVSAFLDEMGANPVGALGYRNQACTATITNGVLFNFDQRVGAGITVTKDNASGKDGLPITAKMYVNTMNLGEQSATVYATIVTSATKPAEFTQDLNHAETLNTGAGADVGEMSAEDTYGLALDLWVRTNADNSYLTLEGNVLTKSEEVDAKGKDSNGNEVQLYTLSRTITDEATGDSATNTYDLYKVETATENEDGTTTTTTTWYRADTFSVFEVAEDENPVLKKETVITVIGFEGENRVWNSDEDKINLSTDATTQGSGSCYVYYADSPEDQARSLELLKAMHVAFVDVNGLLLASATMDTARSYEESGRVIVPLVLDSNSIELGDSDNSLRAITRLEKNVPTRITAIVYLDGTMLSNENVLSAADIQGQLNIQFGSSSEMEPIRNETLELAERKVTATVSPTTFSYDTDTDLTSRVSVMVSGDQPEKVTAFFIRKINDTQGSREPVMTNFVQNETTGAWECDYTFTAPGIYVLRTVELDGQEYALPFDESTPLPTVTVTGFTIESLSCTQASSGNKINIMTASNSSTVDLKLKFASSDQSKMPTTVQGRFLRSDGTAVNVNFTYNPSGANRGYWTGSATFLASGDYTFQYLLLDGEYTELPSNFWQTATVKLGMRVAVYTNGNTSFKYLPSEMADNEKVLGMSVKVMDNSGKEIAGLQNVWLTYCLSTSSVSQMRTELKWNAASEYYTGELLTLESGGPGTWKFSNVTVGGNTLTNATTSPTFVMQAPEPPSYSGITNKSAYQFAPDGKAFMQANIKYSATATVLAVITDASGKEYEVQGKLASTDTDTNVSTWYFTVPDNASGKQDGYWTMKELHVWNYFEEDGTYVSAEIDADGYLVSGGERDEPKAFDVSGENYTMKVVETVNIFFGTDRSQDFGKTGDKVTGAFMATYTVSGLSVDIYDFEHQQLATEVTLSYVYGNNSKEYGGYTSASITNANTDFTITLEKDATGTHFAQQGSHTLMYAGTYTPTFTFKINGATKTYAGETLIANTPTFTVSSVVPTVKIIEAYYASASSQTVSTFTNTSTTVYAHEYQTESVVCGTSFYYDAYHQPYVTIELAGYGNADGATLTFTESNGGVVLLYTAEEGTTSVDNFSWSANGNCKRWVGFWESVTGDDKRTKAGTLTATKLILTDNNISYEVDVDDITISNPN